MALILKNVKKAGRSMYLYYPEFERHNPYLVSLITVIRGDDTRESAERLLDAGLRDLAEKGRYVLAFPNPTAAGWNSELKTESQDDLAAIDALLDEVTKEDDDPLKTNWIGIPMLSEMIRQWHLMNTVRYLIGTDGGEDMALAYAACRPEHIAAVLSLGGKLSTAALDNASGAPVTAILCGSSEEAVDYFRKACSCTEEEQKDSQMLYKNPINTDSFVVSGDKCGLNPALLQKVYESAFGKLRKINTGKYGDMDHLSDLTGDEFTWFIEDERLGDGKHTWLVHVPSTLPAGEKVPLVMFYHGGSDNPTEAAHMAKLHELGRQEHFITVYPWGTNRASWNINYDASEDAPSGNEDEVFGVKLIDYMIENYPVDPQRVYLSGFSNGAAMAQVIAMLYPEKIAALMHIDSNWPGNRWKPMELDIMQIPAMRRALEQKEASMRMPVWYTYGTREASCPVYKGCTQQYQYDFWKQFNNIEIRETPEVGCAVPCESGVEGDLVEEIHPNASSPEQYYTINRFFTKDPEPKNYYNYVLMHDKGHEVAPMDPVLGWNYVKQFKRNPDGSVGLNG